MISGAAPERAWSDCVHFQKQPEPAQAKMLALFADLECDDALRATAFIEPHLKSSTKIFMQLLMVIEFNAVQITPANSDGSGEGQNLGHGLFEVACRMSHSCRPNCVWFSSQDGKSKIVRALEPISAGEMITIFHLDQRLLEKPIFQR